MLTFLNKMSQSILIWLLLLNIYIYLSQPVSRNGVCQGSLTLLNLPVSTLGILCCVCVSLAHTHTQPERE